MINGVLWYSNLNIYKYANNSRIEISCFMTEYNNKVWKIAGSSVVTCTAVVNLFSLVSNYFQTWNVFESWIIIDFNAMKLDLRIYFG